MTPPAAVAARRMDLAQKAMLAVVIVSFWWCWVSGRSVGAFFAGLIPGIGFGLFGGVRLLMEERAGTGAEQPLGDAHE